LQQGLPCDIDLVVECKAYIADLQELDKYQLGDDDTEGTAAAESTPAAPSEDDNEDVSSK